MGKDCCYNCFQERSGEGACPRCGYDPAWDRGRSLGALPHGSILAGRYITGRVLGRGGFGITYVALEQPSGEKVAVKEYLPMAAARRLAGTALVAAAGQENEELFRYGIERFLEEAQVLAKFTGNPNIVGVRSFFQENGTAYFSMDYIEGISFKTYLRNHGGRVGYAKALRVLYPVMSALEAVHREGLIHRDVTPDNIYIAGDISAPAGQAGKIKLLDFGAARYSLGDRSRSLDVILKSGYAPKEQYTRRGRQGPYSDVYSLAACFYASVTGVLPPTALERLEYDELVPISRRGVRIPPELDAVICKALAVQPEDRFQTMEEFSHAVACAMAGPPGVPPEQRPGRSPAPPAQPPAPRTEPKKAAGPSPAPLSPAKKTRGCGAIACAVLCAVGAAMAPGLLLSSPAFGILSGVFALAAGAAAALLSRQAAKNRSEPLYRDACAAYSGGNYPQAVQLFQKAARLGDSRAKYCLGECFRWGNGVPQGMKAAFKWYLAAAKSGNEDAFYSVGCCYAAGEGVEANMLEAARWLEKAAASRSGAAVAARRMLEGLGTRPGGPQQGKQGIKP